MIIMQGVIIIHLKIHLNQKRIYGISLVIDTRSPHCVLLGNIGQKNKEFN